MIVNCPECETSFNLPDAKVASKRGAKVRCSKCEHVFRVRKGENGDPEVFYKNDGVADPPTQDLSAFVDELDADSAATVMGQPGVSLEALSDVEEDAARKTMMGFPSIDAPPASKPIRSKSASSSFNPFPLAGLTDTPAEPESNEIDLFDGADPSLAADEADPFGDVFPEKAEPEPEPEPAPAPEPTPVVKPAPEVAALPGLEQTAHGDEDAPLPDIFLGKGTSDFGRADDLVDPSFGQGDYFDPDQGKISSSTPKPAPTTARHAPQARRPAQVAPAPAKAAAKPAASFDAYDDIAPHKIGGGGFQKFVNFLLILIIVIGGLLGFMAFKTGGVLDFMLFEHMMEVALQGKEFEPRKEWQKAPPPPKVVVADPLKISDVFAQLMTAGSDQALVIRGKVKNTGESKSGAKVRVVVLDEKGKILREQTVVVGEVWAAGSAITAKSGEELGSLPREPAATLEAGQSARFQGLILDVPEAVLENGDVSYRVEIVN